MTVVYTLEVTTQFKDGSGVCKAAEECVLSPKYKQMWEHKVENETERVIPDVNVVCTNIQVFGGTEA